MEKMLEKMEISYITSFSDGKEYLDYINKNDYSPDILLLDIIMVEIDGDKLCQTLRKMGHKYPIIAVTGNLLDDDLIYNYMKIGFNKVINKPYTKKKIKNSFR